MVDFLAKISDSHRHHYDKPPYHRADPVYYNPYAILVDIKRIPPVERTCIKCGVNEKEVQHYQKTHRPKLPTEIPLLNARSVAKKAAAVLHEKDSGGLNNFAIIHGKTRYKIKYFWKQACYGTLGYEDPGQHKYFVDRAGHHPTAGTYSEYQEWCMTNSPYAMAFVNDHPHYVETQCTIQDCTKMSAAYIIGAAMQFRYLGEHATIPSTWTALVKFGVDPAIAFIAASWGQVKDARYFPNNYGPTTGHTIFDGGFGTAGLQNYLDHNPQDCVEIEKYGYGPDETKFVTKTLEKAIISMNYHGLIYVWQPKPTDKRLVMPGTDTVEIVDALGRKQQKRGFDFSIQTVEKFHDEFLKKNGVIYEPKESVYRERGSTVCTDVSQCRMESSKA